MAPPSEPQQFGKYTLLERIAVGGMAEVYRAKTYGAAGFEKELAIKRILPKFTGDDEFVRLFIDEARLAARLVHPNLVQIFDFDTVDTSAGAIHYIAMEWVDGRDLRHLLKEMAKRQHFLSPAAAVHIAIEALRGLHHAHTRVDNGQPQNIVHRDVSPHNILLSYSGDVKVSDFGIAKAAQRAYVTSNGLVKGKLAYMSPEQITGRPLDRRTDVFSLGIVLFELLTHTRLFAGEAEIDVIQKVRDGVVPPPRERNPDIPEDLERVLYRLLARDLDERFQSAQDAARALAATSVYSPTEGMSLGEFVAALFPPGQPRAEVAPPRTSREPSKQRPTGVPMAASPPPTGKSENMSNGQNPPSGKPPSDGMATMMLEAPQVPAPAAPSGQASADVKTAILDANSPQVQAVQAQIAAAAAARNAAPPPAAPPMSYGAPPPAAPPPPAASAISDQRTAILDANSPQMQAMQAQIAAASAQRQSLGAPAPGGDQRTAILDVNAAGLNLPRAPGSAGPQRDAGGRSPAPRPAPMPQQSLRDLEPARQPATWMRWVIGPLISLGSAGVTYGAAGVVLPRHAIVQQFTPPPPPPVQMGKIRLETSPPGASVLVDGKPHPRYTPCDIEGPIGETATHLVVKVDGYQPKEQDVLFASSAQKLSLILEKADVPPPDPKAGNTNTKKKGGAGGHGGGISLIEDKGTVSVFVLPEASVAIDGQLVGKTPLKSLTLSPGNHTIELNNPALGKSETVKMEVKPGVNPPLRVDWTRSAR